MLDFVHPDNRSETGAKEIDYQQRFIRIITGNIDHAIEVAGIRRGEEDIKEGTLARWNNHTGVRIPIEAFTHDISRNCQIPGADVEDLQRPGCCGVCADRIKCMLGYTSQIDVRRSTPTH